MFKRLTGFERFMECGGKGVKGGRCFIRPTGDAALDPPEGRIGKIKRGKALQTPPLRGHPKRRRR